MSRSDERRSIAGEKAMGYPIFGAKVDWCGRSPLSLKFIKNSS